MSILVYTNKISGYFYFHDTTTNTEQSNYDKRIINGIQITQIICDDRNMFVKNVRDVFATSHGNEIANRFKNV